MFQGWENFYFMVGSAGAGLIGLLFVVVTLTAGTDRSQVQRGQQLYMTPTALAFALVLAISAVAMAPGLPHWTTAAVIAAMALLGLANGVRACVGIRMHRPGSEPPHWSDFWMYGFAPAAAYFALAAASVAVGASVPWSVHALAACVLGLLLVGLRNAWDLVTWIAPKRPGPTA